MKKTKIFVAFVLMLCLVLSLTLVACDFDKNSTTDNVNNEQNNDNQTPEPDDDKTPELVPAEGLEYVFSEDKIAAVVVGIGTVTATDIVIANEYVEEGVVIVLIASKAFRDCDNLTSVVIGDRVVSIGGGAFRDCDNLTSVVIGDDVTSIGDSAFYDCDSLTSVVIGDSVTSIGDSAFYGYMGLAEVYYKGTEAKWSNISIGGGNDKLTSVTRYYYSETQPTEAGNWWHFDSDGITPIKW